MIVEVPQGLENPFYRILDDEINVVVPQVHTRPF